VSSTRQTTTAPISIGLPRLSLTFRRSPLRLRARSEIFMREPRFGSDRLKSPFSFTCRSCFESLRERLEPFE
jgi:hypothetical protein